MNASCDKVAFVVVIKCIAHREPLTVKHLFFPSMRDVSMFFDNFGLVYKGRRCFQHSHDALIPVLAGVTSGGSR